MKERIKVVRIEAKNIERLFKIIKYSGIALIALSLVKLVFIYNFTFEGIGQFLDFAIFLLFGILILSYNKKNTSTRKGQYIEWKESSIEYKLKTSTSIVTVEYSNILHVEIKMDMINLTLKNNTVLRMDISDFKSYENRTLIKSNFETLRDSA